MRPTLVAFIACLAACAPAGPPLTETIGYAAFDRSERILYIRNDPYVIPEDVNTTFLLNGNRVRIYWEQVGDDRVVRRWYTDKRRRRFAF